MAKAKACTCVSPLYWEQTVGSVSGLWYFAQTGVGSLQHKGHMTKTAFENKHMLCHHSNEAKKLALAFNEAHLDSSIIGVIIHQNKGEELDASQI